jgi:hypothetical protein
MSVSRWRTLILALTAQILAAADLAAQAATPPPAAVLGSRAPYRILLDQLTGSIEVRNPRGQLLEGWTAAERTGGTAAMARIPAGAPLVVEVVNANPLLYRYDLQTAVVARKSLPMCRNLGSRFAMTGVLTSFATVATATQPILGQTIGQLFQPPPDVAETATRGETMLTAAALDSALIEHQAPVARYAGFLSTVRNLAQTIGDSLAVIAELAESQPMDSLLSGLGQSLERTYPGLSQPARIPLTVREQAQIAGPHLAALAHMSRAIQRGNSENTASADEIVRLVVLVEENQRDLAASYRELQSQLSRMQAARAQARPVFSTGGSNDVRRLTLTVDPTPEWPTVFRARLGRQELYTEPTVSFLCQVSIGVGFMDRPPEYALEGSTVVNRANSQRTGVALMLHFASSRLPLLGALLGVGFGSGDMPDLYAGGSLRLLDPLLLNFGAVWQRTEQLPSGFAVGQPAPDPARLFDLRKRYEPGFFWGVSIAR